MRVKEVRKTYSPQKIMSRLPELINPFRKSVNGKTAPCDRRGQAAMEFLMTYGWAILVVLIAIAALYAMGVFEGGGGTSCKIDAPLTCDLTVSAGTPALSKLVVTAQGVAPGTGANGQIAVTGDCTGNLGTLTIGENTVTPLTCSGVQKGQKLKGELTVDYRIVGSSLAKRMTGTWSTEAAV